MEELNKGLDTLVADDLLKRLVELAEKMNATELKLKCVDIANLNMTEREDLNGEIATLYEGIKSTWCGALVRYHELSKEEPEYKNDETCIIWPEGSIMPHIDYMLFKLAAIPTRGALTPFERRALRIDSNDEEDIKDFILTSSLEAFLGQTFEPRLRAALKFFLAR